MHNQKLLLNTCAILVGTILTGQTNALGQAGAPILVPGFLKFESFSGISGTPVQNLLDDVAKFQANKPDEVLYMGSFNTRTVYPNDSHDNFGARISGVVIPSASGDYEFFLRSDDASQLFLNPAGDAVAGLQMIAEETGCCNAFQEPGATQTSTPFTLQAGKAYAIQALYKEGGGGDFCQVAWRRVGDATPPAQLSPIPGSFLATLIPAGGTINITKQPSNVTAAQNDFVTLGLELTVSGGPVVVQWQKNGANIPGLTGTTVSVGPLAASDNGAKYRAVVSIPGATVTSAESTFTVSADVTPPKIKNVIGSGSFDTVTVEFSEAVTAASAGRSASYTIDGGITVSSATVLSATMVRLGTSKQTLGATYTLTVKDVLDTANNPAAANTTFKFPAFAIVKGGVKLEAFYGLSGAGVTDLDNFVASEKYQNNQPDLVAYVSQFTSRLALPDASNGLATRENYGGKLSGWIVPTETAEYEFFIRSDDASQLYLSTDDTVEKAVLIAQENGCCGPFEEVGAGDNGDGTFPTSAPQALTAGKRYYIHALWKEGGGGDYCDVAWRKKGNAAFARTLPYISGSVLETVGAPGALVAPVVMISSPAPDSTFEINAPITLSTTITPGPGKSIVQVDYLEQGRIIASSTVSPYSATLFGVTEGAHSYIARATDSAGVFADSPPLPIAVGVPTKVIEIVKIDDKSEWSYDRSGQELGTAWRELAFDDSKWPKGKALIADESTTTVEPIRTPISRLNDDGVYVQTFYFRHKFNFTDGISSGVKLKLRHVVDDGVVFYLNGKEIHRFGIAAGVDFDSTTSFGGHENIYEGPYDIDPSLLIKGMNILAAEVHQSGGSSSDMVFGAELVATVPCVVRDVGLLKIDDVTTWRYDRSGQDLGTEWRQKAFDDSKWPQGKTLIADESTTTVEPIRTPISRLNDDGVYVQTFYFRAHFNFPGSTSGAKLKMRHVVDDGVVIYLNGKEIHRFGIAADAAFDFSTSFGGHENIYEGPYDVPLDLVVPGDNVIAAEVHQSGGSSSDMVFGLELVATITDCGGAVEPPKQPARLSVSRSGANVQISWTESGVLQSAASLSSPIVWTDVAGATSPHPVSPGDAAKFYRVIKK